VEPAALVRAQVCVDVALLLFSWNVLNRSNGEVLVGSWMVHSQPGSRSSLALAAHHCTALHCFRRPQTKESSTHLQC
jgi:hypothetical protein